jgi:hypothetical protein
VYIPPLRVFSVPHVINALNPTTILRAVPLVVVDPINLMTITGSGTHVIVELLKIVTPLITDGDTSTTVILVGVILRVVTA